MTTSVSNHHIITVNLNTAIDRVIEVSDLKIGDHAKGRQISRFPAGKAINVSRSLARINRDSIATGFVGQKESQQFEQFLKETGPGKIICQLLAVRGQTRENITLLDTTQHIDTHIRDEGFKVLDTDFHRLMSKLGLLSRPDTIIVFSGSLPQGIDVSKLNMLLMIAMSGGAKVILDMAGDILRPILGIDQSFLSQHTPKKTADEESTVDSHIFSQTDNPIWMIKPNALELAQLLQIDELKTDEQIVQAGLALAQKIEIVMITLGFEGAWLIHGRKAWRGRADMSATSAVNTVGCGDATIAGVLDAHLKSSEPTQSHSLSDDGQMEALLRRGLAVATANSLWPGVAEFDLQQVNKLEQIIHVEAYQGKPLSE